MINGATDVLLSMLMELLKLGNLATKDIRKNYLVKEKAMQSVFSQFHPLYVVHRNVYILVYAHIHLKSLTAISNLNGVK